MARKPTTVALGAAWVLVCVLGGVLTSCQNQEERPPWVLIYRDTQDQETYLDVSRIGFRRLECSLWISTKRKHPPGTYLYRRVVIRLGHERIRTLESLVISSDGKVEVEEVEPVWREAGTSGLDRILYDLVCPEGTAAPVEEIRRKAWSIESVLLRLNR